MKERKSTLLIIMELLTAFLFVVAIAAGVVAYVTNETPSSSYMPVAVAPVNLGNAGAIPDGSSLALQPDETPAPERVDAEMRNVSIPGWKVITVSSGTTDVTVDFFNPEDNTGAFYLTFSILMPSAGGGSETLWSSGLVEPGSHIRSITLSRALEAGEYPGCTLHIQPYFMSDKTPANNADLEFTLVAE